MDKAYIKVLEGNSSVTFVVTDDGSKSYIINEVLQTLDGTVDLHYIVELLLGCNYLIEPAPNPKLPVYTVDLNLGTLTFSHNFSGNLSGYYDLTKNYMTC